MTIWASLLLQLNPLTLNASQRIRLVDTMADYLHLPLGFVYLFSRRKSHIQQQEKLRVCRRGGLTRGSGKQDASADVAQLLWHFGCQEEQRHDLAKVIEYSVTAGGLDRLLEVPVLGWSVLCASEVVRHKAKRDLQRLKFTPTPINNVSLPTEIHQTVRHEHSYMYSLPLTKLEPSLSTILLHMNHTQSWLDPTHSEDSTEKMAGVLLRPSHAQTNTLYRSDINPDIPIAFLKTNHMQKKHLSSNPIFSIKKTTLYPYSKEDNPLLEGQIELGCSSLHHSQEYIKQTASNIKPHVEVTGCNEQVSVSTISEYFWSTELYYLPFLSEHISTVRTFVEGTSSDTAFSFSPSFPLYSIYTSLPLTPESYSVTSALTHEAVDRKSLATRLTLRPHPKETPLWTGAYRASRTDSESQPTVSSLGKSAAVDFYMTICDCSGCLVIQVICCNDLTLFEREPTAE